MRHGRVNFLFHVLEVVDVVRRLSRKPCANGSVHVTGTSVGMRGSDLLVLERNSTKP